MRYSLQKTHCLFSLQMEILLKWFSTYSLLTFFSKRVKSFVLQINTPIVLTQGALPVEARKGILTLTLVISRESGNPTVKRGICRMFKIFKVKINIRMQLEEYVQFKAKTSPFIAQAHKEILSSFVKSTHYKDISEVTIADLNAYHIKIGSETTQYTAIRVMQALRAFVRFHKRHTQITPDEITDEGVRLQPVVKNAIIPQMKAKRIGRPYGSIELIKKIKRLKDMEDLSFRKIGLVTGKNVSHVYKMYRYNLTNS